MRPFRGGKVGYAWGYNLTHPGVGGILGAAGRELRWYGVTIGQVGIGVFRSVKLRKAGSGA